MISNLVSAGDILQLFNDQFDSCHDTDVCCGLMDGFCSLILRDRYFDKKVMTKLITMYFDKDIESKLIQVLGIFFETIVRLRKQKYLLMSLSDTLTAIIIDEELDTLRSVLKFFIHSMMTEGENQEIDTSKHLHNDLAFELLTWMSQNSSENKSMQVVSKEILALKIVVDEELRSNLRNLVDDLLEEALHKETEKNLKLFKQTLQSLQFSSIRPANGVGDDDDISVTSEISNEVEAEIIVSRNDEIGGSMESSEENSVENCIENVAEIDVENVEVENVIAVVEVENDGVENVARNHMEDGIENQNENNNLPIVPVNEKENENKMRRKRRIQESPQTITKQVRNNVGKRKPLFTLQ